MSEAPNRAAPHVFLIHATPVAIDPIKDAFRAMWPQASLANLLEDSLPGDLKRDGRLTDAMFARFDRLTRYAVDTGADAILYTCSAFGPAIEASRAHVRIPVLKPNEAMIERALERGRSIGLVATFGPSLPSIRREFEEAAQARNVQLEFRSALAEGAYDALFAGEVADHDRRIAAAVASVAGCDVVCFAQFSMQSALAAATQATRTPILTTPDTAVRELQKRLGVAAG